MYLNHQAILHNYNSFNWKQFIQYKSHYINCCHNFLLVQTQSWLHFILLQFYFITLYHLYYFVFSIPFSVYSLHLFFIVLGHEILYILSC